MVEEILTIPPQFPSAVFISEDSQSVRAQFELLNIVERPGARVLAAFALFDEELPPVVTRNSPGAPL
jgi:hypothetical protein